MKWASTDNQRLIQQAQHLANEHATIVLRSEGTRTVIAGWVFFDTRPMLDPREKSGPAIDMAQCVIDYALTAGVAMRHPTQPHLLRLLS